MEDERRIGERKAIPPTVRTSGWQREIISVHSEALDCLQTSVALVADRIHGADAHLALGARWRFPDAHGVLPPTSMSSRLSEAEVLLGLSVLDGPREVSSSTELAGMMSLGGHVYVVADAYDMRWLPYASRKHMPHSFLLEHAGATNFAVVDAYANETEYGPATPGSWLLTSAELDGVLRVARAAVLGCESSSLARFRSGPTQGPLATNPHCGLDSYIEVMGGRLAGLDEAAIDGLTLDIWALARERLLRREWMAPCDEAAGLANDWRALARQCYLAMRRARFGRRFSNSLIDDFGDLLHRDADFSLRLHTYPQPGKGDAQRRRTPHHVRNCIVGATCEVLSLDQARLEAIDSFDDIPGFSSFRLLDIIDRVEARLGVSLPADVPVQYLGGVDGLCQLFTAPGGAR